MSNSIYRQNLIDYWRQFFPNWNVPKGFHVHHIVPKSIGGTDHSSNLIALHPDDHAAIHRLRGDKAVHGMLISIKGYKHTDKTKEKLRQQNIGKRYTDETKQKHSIQMKNQWASGIRDNVGSKVALAQKGKCHLKYIWVTPWGEYPSRLVAIEKIKHVNKTTLSRCCKNPSNIISKLSFSKSKYLQHYFDESIIGQTFESIGFGLVPRST